MNANGIKAGAITKIYDGFSKTGAIENAPEAFGEQLDILEEATNSDVSVNIIYGYEPDSIQERSLVCLNNCIHASVEGRFRAAWDEAIDIIDYHSDDDELTVEDLALLHAAYSAIRFAWRHAHGQT